MDQLDVGALFGAARGASSGTSASYGLAPAGFAVRPVRRARRRAEGAVRRDGARPAGPGRVPPPDAGLLAADLTRGTPGDILSPVSRDPLTRGQVFEARVERWRPDLMAALGRLYADPDAVADRLLAIARTAYDARPDELHDARRPAAGRAGLVPAARRAWATRRTPTGSPAPSTRWPTTSTT